MTDLLTASSADSFLRTASNISIDGGCSSDFSQTKFKCESNILPRHTPRDFNKPMEIARSSEYEDLKGLDEYNPRRVTDVFEIPVFREVSPPPAIDRWSLPSSYIRKQELRRDRWEDVIEYEADSEDRIWLAKFNANRTDHSPLLEHYLELLMDRLEKEYYLTLEIREKAGPSHKTSTTSLSPPSPSPATPAACSELPTSCSGNSACLAAQKAMHSKNELLSTEDTTLPVVPTSIPHYTGSDVIKSISRKIMSGWRKSSRASTVLGKKRALVLPDTANLTDLEVAALQNVLSQPVFAAHSSFVTSTSSSSHNSHSSLVTLSQPIITAVAIYWSEKRASVRAKHNDTVRRLTEPGHLATYKQPELFPLASLNSHISLLLNYAMDCRPYYTVCEHIFLIPRLQEEYKSFHNLNVSLLHRRRLSRVQLDTADGLAVLHAVRQHLEMSRLVLDRLLAREKQKLAIASLSAEIFDRGCIQFRAEDA